MQGKLSSEHTKYANVKDDKEILVFTFGKTVLHYNINALNDLYYMLKAHSDVIESGSADGQKSAKESPGGIWAVIWKPCA